MQIIDIQDNKKWQTIVNRFDHLDFYYTAHYHQLSAEKDEQLKLLYFNYTDIEIAFPVIIRPITAINFPNYYDITSVYGYAGPLIKGTIDRTIIQSFTEEFKQYCMDNNIVSAFARLHTWVAHTQIQLLQQLGFTEEKGKTVYINTLLTLEEQRKQYRKSNKSEINQLKRLGVIIRPAKNDTDVQCFMNLYTQNMNRVSANTYYFFKENYFKSFLQTADYESFILLAEFENKILAGAIFTISGKIMQYHLAGTDESHLKITPMKLIIDTAREIATSRNLELLHLGGGLGGNENDNLYNFKKGFSDFNFNFYVWKYICNETIYQKLVEEKNINNKNANYFPLYRAT